MRTHTARVGKLLIPLALLTTGLAVGCGGEQAGSHGVDADSTRHARARAVADAWAGSAAAQMWAKGYYPMGEVIELPEGAFHTGADKEAYATQNFVLDGTLPTSGQRKGEAKWKDGGSLRLPMMSAREAYDSVARGGNDGPHLTVTGAKLGTTTLLTSRGPATVPAWLFALKGYDTPLKRVALSPMKAPKAPIVPAAESPSDELWPLERLVGVSGGGRSVTVLAGHGACDDGPVVDVLETDATVVLSAWITGTKDGSCTSQLLFEEVTVKLGRALDDRILLDAFTGRPVQPGSRD
ncbi:hypothetical protein [Streptomyces cylindrosporus]|uniref:Lipoprotein n=1 Tax=Streptomyces cylindrosporus TaxID=2927583 RepID=A0ABS9YLY5_9ACTN|nr:hypothetical protein [Streptomyces cylindrosporus]MCI3278272.1 hypothetical protein [Streptomyces cylindrosporus]